MSNEIGKAPVMYNGHKMKPGFDPMFLEQAGRAFKNNFHNRNWEPMYINDMKLKTSKSIDILRTIVDKVKRKNESKDCVIVGDRGVGKSAFGLSLATQLHRIYHNDPKATFPMDQVCFSVSEWILACNNLKAVGGGVVILDEVGVSASLSSRESMSKENRSTADIVQLARTDAVITIYISVDRDRIDKRVRQLASILITPIAKLNNEQTGGHGLYLEADLKIRTTRPASEHDRHRRSENDSGYLTHQVSHYKYGAKSLMYSILLPHPGIKSWKEYSVKRDIKLEEIREAAFTTYDQEAKRDTDKTIAKEKAKQKEVAQQPAQVKAAPKPSRKQRPPLKSPLEYADAMQSKTPKE